MKKFIVLFIALFTATSLFAQKMVKIYPNKDTLCYGESIYIHIPGQSFYPISYLWSNGSTSSTINATNSGTYTLSLTGYLGHSAKLVTLNLVKTFDVLNKPVIVPLSDTWVCKLDTVQLTVSNGYSNYSWNNGNTSLIYEKIFNDTITGQVLDTISVWYTATKQIGSYTCSATSDTIVIRAIRRPEALTPKYCGATNLSLLDTIKTGLVLTYVYAPVYEVEFADSLNPANTISYITTPGSRLVPLNMLQVGNTYIVKTRAVINNVPYCWGSSCAIYIASNARIGASINFEMKTYRIYDTSGKYIISYSGQQFNQAWLSNLPAQLYIVLTIQNNNIIERKLMYSNN